MTKPAILLVLPALYLDAAVADATATPPGAGAIPVPPAIIQTRETPSRGGGAVILPPPIIQPGEMAPPVPGSEIVPEDFAWRLPIQIRRGRSPAISLEFTGELYRCLTRPDLGDLRVFDAGGKLLPFIIDPPHSSGVSQPVWRPLPFFPLAGFAAGEAGTTPGIHIETRPNGAIIDIRGGQARMEDGKAGAYLLDLGVAKQGSPRSLRLEWEEGGPGPVEVTVEQSADLHHWRPVTKTVLARLRFGGHRIDRNTVDITGPLSRYLRLSWPRGEPGIVLHGVRLRLDQHASAPPLHWTRPAVMEEGLQQGMRSLLLDSGGSFPVTGLRVRLPRPDSLATIRIASAGAVGGPWRVRHQGVVYHLSLSGREVHSDDIPLTQTSDRYWRITLIDGFSLGGGLPELELGWRPHRMRFLASGRPPLFLACGNPRIAPLSPDFVRTLRRSMFGTLPFRMVGEATSGARRPLAGEQLVQPPPAPLPWRQWLLWAVLLVGVLVVGFMVRNLWREMQSKR